MKHINVLLLLAALPFLGMAQTISQIEEQYLKSVKERKGWYIGLGIFGADQTTHWKYDQTPPAIGVPFYNASLGFDHDVSRALLALSIERRSLFGTPMLWEEFFSPYDYYRNYVGTDSRVFFNFIDVDFGADVLFNPSAKTTANWLDDDNNQISSGGFTAGASAYIRAQWVFFLSPKLRMNAFSTGVGVQYMYVQNNGKDVAVQALVKDFNYSKGWNENIAMAYFTVGTLGFETAKFSIMPEARIFLTGTSSTTLKPERLIGDVKMDSKPAIFTYGLKAMIKL